MKISKIKYYQLSIPFKTSINHNLKKRQCSESIIVEIHTESGWIGYGEGAPRRYVTQEISENVMAQIPILLPCLEHMEFDDPNSIEQLIEHIPNTLPSLRAAVEIALLDIWGQQHQCSIGKAFIHNNTFTPIYSAVLPFLPLQKMNKWIDLVKSIGFQQIKLKVGHENDEYYLALIRKKLGDKIDIRLDANRAWSLEEAYQKITALEAYHISSIEEPLSVEDLEYLPDLSRMINIPIVLDESVCTMRQAKHYAALCPTSKLRFNLKLSKMGGLLTASKIHAFATQEGIACQLGCNVGETAILSAAGRIFAQHHPLVALEGSYAPFFMEDDIGKKSISLSTEGKAASIHGAGIGVAIDANKLEKYSLRYHQTQWTDTIKVRSQYVP